MTEAPALTGLPKAAAARATTIGGVVGLIGVAGGVLAAFLLMPALRQRTGKATGWVPASIAAWSLVRLASGLRAGGLLVPGMVLAALNGGHFICIGRRTR